MASALLRDMYSSPPESENNRRTGLDDGGRGNSFDSGEWTDEEVKEEVTDDNDERFADLDDDDAEEDDDGDEEEEVEVWEEEIVEDRMPTILEDEDAGGGGEEQAVNRTRGMMGDSRDDDLLPSQQQPGYSRRTGWLLCIVMAAWFLVGGAIGALVGLTFVDDDDDEADERSITTISPTQSPTVNPTVSPTASPTASPAVPPTASPTDSPTASLTEPPQATAAPTGLPTTPVPTKAPTLPPTTIAPTVPVTDAATLPPTTMAPTVPATTDATTTTATIAPTSPGTGTIASVFFGVDKRTIDQYCARGGQECIDACEPQFSMCCRIDADPNSEEVAPCSFDGLAAECMKYGKCHVLTEPYARPSPAVLANACGRSRLEQNRGSCEELCKPAECCFIPGADSCLVSYFAACIDFAPCQNLRNGTILETAPSDLDALCKSSEPDDTARCTAACEASACCRNPDPVSSCLGDNFMACLTYAACTPSESSESSFIAPQYSTVGAPPSNIGEVCTASSSLLVAAQNRAACSAACEQAACCWAGSAEESCFNQDPLGCLAWEQFCSIVLFPSSDQCGSTWTSTEFINPALTEVAEDPPVLPGLPVVPSVPCEEDEACSTTMAAIDPVMPPSTRALLNVPGTCQNWAREWVRASPELNTFTLERVRQRFALAMVFCEFNGSDWMGSELWVTDLHECDWFTLLGLDPCGRNEDIQIVRLQGQQMRGTLPPELSILSTLFELRLNDNLIAGTIPPDYAKLSQLDTISFAFNQLSGPLPLLLWQYEDLVSLDIGNNFFSGSLPDSVSLLAPNLQHLVVSNNMLGGSIPTDFGQLNWRRLHLSRNRLVGAIPSDIHSPEMEELLLHDNLLSGTFPTAPFVNDIAGGASRLRTVTIFNNGIEGSVEEMCPLSTGSGSLQVLAVDSDKVVCSCCIGPCDLY